MIPAATAPRCLLGSTAVILGIGLGLGLSGATVARADGHHHDLPPEYAMPGWDLPPASFAEAEYPLAAQFIEADASNFTAGGIDVVEYVVVHTMQGYYEGSINWFLNPSSDVSAHFCIRSEDGEITQMVGLDDRAWHVGNSNPWAIGIEHEGFVDDASWYTYAMYDESAKLARWLADHFALPLDRDHIVGHVELPNQTHTDPGGNWDWELYMALVQDQVGEGVIEGVVVDPDRACTLVANVDTHLRATLQDAGALGDDRKCFVAAGTEVSYLHAGVDRIGQRRLVLAPGGPCAALGEGFAYAADFDGFCAAEDLAVAGASVQLDGAGAVVVGADGAFAFGGVVAGAHDLDAAAAGFESAAVAIDHGGYPGARVVVRLPSLGGGDSTGPDGSSAEGSTPPDPTADPTADPTGGTDDAAGPDDDTGDPADSVDPALPDTFGESEQGAGCGCRGGSGDRGGPGRTGVLLLAVVALRRRSRPRAVAARLC